MKVLNTAVIGCGSICASHTDAISDLKTSMLYGVCDIDRERAEGTAHRLNCACFTDYRELLKDNKVDVVHICTPHYLHAPMAIEAMLCGKHVLTEKPVSISTADAAEMIRISRETGKTLGVCFQNRYNGTSRRIKELLQSGQAGKILGAKALVTWFRDEKYYTESEWRGRRAKEGGGVLINQAIHTLDLVQWFMGEVDGIKAHVDTRLLKGIIEVEDTADAAITFKNGSSCLFFATNNYAANSPVEIEIICEQAVIRLRDKLTITWRDGAVEQVTEEDRATGGKAYWGCSHRYLIRDFHEKLHNGEKFELDGEQGAITIKMIETIYRSSETGEYVKLL